MQIILQISVKSLFFANSSEVFMSVDLVFRIAAIGLITSLLAQILTKAGREEIASLTSLAGLVIVLLMVIDLIREFFESIRTIFMVY